MGRPTTAFTASVFAQLNVRSEQHFAIAAIHDAGRSICFSPSSTTFSTVVLARGVKDIKDEKHNHDGKKG
jgi:hypothetical protein